MCVFVCVCACACACVRVSLCVCEGWVGEVLALLRRLCSSHALLPTFQSEMEILLKTQDELKKGSLKINSMLQEMESKQVLLTSIYDLLSVYTVRMTSSSLYLCCAPVVLSVYPLPYFT